MMLPPDSKDSLLDDSTRFVSRQFAWRMFGVLFAMNLIDYVDRYVLNAVLPEIQQTFKMSDTQAGLMATYFLVSYSLFSPFMGWAGDRYRRTYLLAFGVGVWSLATVGTALADSAGHIALARGFLGIGEATYGVLAPTLLVDVFHRSSRSRVMSFFSLAIPLGGAIGMTLGGYVAKHGGEWLPGYEGWRMAFLISGAPGLLAAVCALFLPEPIRGASEGVDTAKLQAAAKIGANRLDYRDLMVNSSYTYAVFGMAMSTFAVGAIGLWMSTFLTEVRGFEKVQATTSIGLVTAGASLLGMAVSGWLADKLSQRSPKWLFLVPGLAMWLALPFMVLTILSTSKVLILGGMFVSIMFLFMNIGPCNAVISNVIPPHLRAAAFAITLFSIHFLGDIWSSPLVGYVSDMFGDPEFIESGLGKALTSIGAGATLMPDGKTYRNLTAGLLITLPAVFLSGVVMFTGARHLPREMALMLARLKATKVSEQNVE
ncbi:MAG: MFS transporter [Planctomycetota bacterium]|nr:MAG: MFS transporter [Planctomycetota bacterium]